MKSKVYFTRALTPEAVVKMYNALGVELPGKVQVYQLTAETPRASVMQCNGVPLVLGEGYALPAMDPVTAEGRVQLPPMSCTFIITD